MPVKQVSEPKDAGSYVLSRLRLNVAPCWRKTEPSDGPSLRRKSNPSATSTIELSLNLCWKATSRKRVPICPETFTESLTSSGSMGASEGRGMFGP